MGYTGIKSRFLLQADTGEKLVSVYSLRNSLKVANIFLDHRTTIS